MKTTSSASFETRRSSIAASAQAYMLSNIDCPISVRDLASRLDVSERTLRYAFQKEYGLSPWQYLKNTIGGRP